MPDTQASYSAQSRTDRKENTDASVHELLLQVCMGMQLLMYTSAVRKSWRNEWVF